MTEPDQVLARRSDSGPPPSGRPASGRPAIRRLVLGILFACVVLQMTAMALTSRKNAHPDERAHLAVANYYVRWWVPPAAGDSRVVPSLSRYGHSYHYDARVVYFLAGKAVAPVQHLFRQNFHALRFFNIGLFALLAGFALFHRQPRLALLLLLLPAQVWYLFSYFNDDALSLFVGILCCWQVAEPGSAFRRFLAAEGCRTKPHAAFLIALAIAILWLSKKNYQPLVLFLAFYAAWMVASAGDRGRARGLAWKWALVGMLAGCLVWTRGAVDDWVNDPARNQGATKAEMIRAQAELYAADGFKPSHRTRGVIPTLKMKAQGAPFSVLFTEYRWHQLIFQSFVGLYGYMDVFSTRAFYLAMLFAYIALLWTLGVAVYRRGTLSDQVFGLACALFAPGLALVAAYYSWVVDLQAQGRYLFPVFGVLFIFVLRFATFIPDRILWRYGILIWLLSSYSFIATGLGWILKPGS